MEKVKKAINLEFIKFILVGIINTLHFYMGYLLFHGVFDIQYMIAHIAAFMVSLVISFFLNASFTFRVKPTLAKFLQFPFTQFFNMAVSAFFVFLFVEHVGMDAAIAPILSIFITVPFTFIITGKILKR